VVLEGGRSAEAARRRALFRRRRLAVAVAAVTLVVLGVQVAPGVAAALTTPPTVRPAAESISTSRYVAEPGDTLWSIAARLPDHGDVRDAVDLLAEVNGADQIVAGQSVRIPASLLAR
jgi:nucleoid-associated protein YgaU